MKLVIVESPTKAKTISKFLGENFTVTSSYGHIRDLPKSKLGIDVDNNFEPDYVIPTKSRPVLKTLKDLLKKSEGAIIATDEDREGEAIAWHLAEALHLTDKTNLGRIVFHEITEGAINEALLHPRKIDQNLVDAQQARRILDRLVGYKLSPFLWKKVAKGLSAGRVQSVTVRLIVDRENEIRNFKPQEYWTMNVDLNSQNGILESVLTQADKTTLDKFYIQNAEMAEATKRDLENGVYKVQTVEKKVLKKNPPPPFITSTMQQEAAKRLGFSSKKTMLLAQRLYEVGLITYMRTDSLNLSRESLTAAKKYLASSFGEEYSKDAPRTYQTKSRMAQEAHEAIRPTKVEVAPDEAQIEDASGKKLYRLIWQRFLASQMPQAIFDAESIEVFASCPLGTKAKEYTLKANGNILRFDGFLKVWQQKFEEKELPVVDQGEKLDLKELKPAQHFTEPAARYSEASLIKTLESFGIGRPSTYAPTISVIQLRNYVKKEKGRFYPTEIGEMVNKVLTEHFPEIVDVDFTAKLETGLDEIANGNEKWTDLMGAFYVPFAKNLEIKYAEVKKTVTDEKTDIVCEKCGKPMVIKFGRFGKFLACSGFPECKNTKQIAKEPPKSTGIKCPDCLASPDRKDAPGEIVERRVSRGRARGKIFWGCSLYPKCKYATWENPVKSKDAEPEASS